MKRTIFRFCAGCLLATTFFLTPSLPGATPDTLRVLAIRVEFQEDNDETTTGNGKFDLSTSTDPYQIDPPPHNRSYFQDHLLFLRNYFWKVSRGRLVIESEVFPLEENAAYLLPRRMAEYNPNTTPDEINRGLANLLKDALQVAAADSAIDFRSYDSFIVFHAGVGKDVDLGFDDTPQDIPSLFITREFLQRYLKTDGIQVREDRVIYNGIILPETESQDGLQLALNGILVANFASQLGWLDLFNPETHRSGIGRFGLMDAGLFNGDGLLPALPSAWTRIEAGWETARTVYQAQDDVLELHWVLSNQEPRVYRFPVSEKEYFLVENRYAGKMNLDSLQYAMAQGRDRLPTMKEVLLTHFPEAVTFSERGVLVDVDNPDRGLPGSGILIWHIDENVIEAKRARNRINDDDRHRGVDLEEADGSQDIGQIFDFFSAGAGSEIGTVLDLWYAGNPAPVFQNEFSENTFPNSRSYYNRANSHIKLSHFSGPDSVMQFRARIDIYQTYFPVQLQVQRVGKPLALRMADLNHKPGDEMLIQTDKQRVIIFEYPTDFPGPPRRWIYGFDEPLMVPVAVVDFPDGDRGLAVAFRNGKIQLGIPDGGTFRPVYTVLLDDTLTTYPVFDNTFQVLGEQRVFQLFVGTRRGRVWKIAFEDNAWVNRVMFDIQEPVEQILIPNRKDVWIVSQTGTMYLNGEKVWRLSEPFHPPAGYSPLLSTFSGTLRLLESPDISAAFEGRYSLFSAASQFTDEHYQLNYALGGDNRLIVVNSRLAMRTDFPVSMYRPYQAAPIRFPPLVGVLNRQGEKGIVITDPGGLVDAYSLEGRRLAEFPLSVGDSIDASPALGDVDGDGDVELVALTRSGWVYAWDLPGGYGSRQREGVWLQALANEYNQNRIDPGVVNVIAQEEVVIEKDLLPAERAYCWPNPSRDNYTIIRYWLSEPAKVTIRIYDLAGDLVAEFPGPGQGRKDNEVRWDLTDVQSGVYFARIQATSSRKEMVRMIKIAVVK